MDGLYNKHYIRTREDGCITHGFSDAFEQPQEGDLCINERGGYQFRLKFAGGGLSEENPVLADWETGVPLWRFDGLAAVPRPSEEIEAEAAALPQPGPPADDSARLAALEAQLTDTQLALCDVYELLLGQKGG